MKASLNWQVDDTAHQMNELINPRFEKKRSFLGSVKLAIFNLEIVNIEVKIPRIGWRINALAVA